MRILLVEDDRPLSDALALSLKNANYAVDCVYTGADAMTTLSIGQTDIVVLDLGLPDTDGLNVLKSIRKKNATLPVLILTARDKVSDKISGLDAGADDYLPKPFEIDELLARLRVLERRLGTASQTIITIKNVSLDTAHHTLTIDNETIYLPRRELMVLKALVENAGRVLVGFSTQFEHMFKLMDPHARGTRSLGRRFNSETQACDLTPGLACKEQT